ncbi:MAG TPA: N-acetylmuramoyl-L-alanine amidase [Acidimicrobiales bacterium]|nr:N-acetylmuramoyl-L-alanine amidase [Acidimicrobiales bacterium]
MRVARLTAVLVLALAVTSCSRPAGPELAAAEGDGGAVGLIASTTTVESGPKLAQQSSQWPKLDTSGNPRAIVTNGGVVVPVRGPADGGGWRITTPCGKESTLRSGRTIGAVHVVLDPGHGGTEIGAVAGNGMREKDVNLALAQAVADKLRAQGVSVQLTREADYRVPIVTRAEIVNSLHPKLFISIHHNGGGAPVHTGPGTEVFFQKSSPESKRLAGLVWQDVFASLSPFNVKWIGATDAGAIYRSDRDGSDFYGVLRRTAGVPAALAEIAYLSNAPEADIIGRGDFRDAAAAGIASAVVRYFSTNDPGGGFNTPVFRGYDDGGGGTTANCKDPALT